MATKQQLIGVISDTHGLLRPEVLQAFKGVRLIVHAGDIGSPEVLDALQTLAPVVAVRGNNDTGPWAKKIQDFEVVRVGTVALYVLHDLNEIKRKPLSKDIQVVISGHSH